MPYSRDNDKPPLDEDGQELSRYRKDSPIEQLGHNLPMERRIAFPTYNTTGCEFTDTYMTIRSTKESPKPYDGQLVCIHPLSYSVEVMGRCYLIK
ncbi:hypothetical protein T265_00690 [Opisthorchis viverrini]|uniref:Uncharacterized protein n=1 Tax=Opisthorchis viverrini TaxID=6198 RepID=A0A075AJH0_OPIVI|nr:hypothetical protein T265_00690 [Opisthorchis viverrini]KER33369.1 hypothetical protein T265_00690 [Opisthorchis viverrini]